MRGKGTSFLPLSTIPMVACDGCEHVPKQAWTKDNFSWFCQKCSE